VLTANARGFLVKSNEAICMFDRHKTNLVPSSESQNSTKQFDANSDVKWTEAGVEKRTQGHSRRNNANAVRLR
jgi:hypothetical protein